MTLNLNCVQSKFFVLREAVHNLLSIRYNNIMPYRDNNIMPYISKRLYVLVNRQHNDIRIGTQLLLRLYNAEK